MLYVYVYLIIQILLENFPISSSGHLALLEYYVGSSTCNVIFSSLYTISHLPTACIILLFFHKRLLLFFHKRSFLLLIRALFLLGVADSITVICFVLKKLLCISIPLYIGFSITALVLYTSRWCTQESTVQFSFLRALIIGFAQGLALVPGVSRFALVFVVSRWLGFSSRHAYMITWLTFLPLIIAASFSACVQLFISGQLPFLASLLYAHACGVAIIVMISMAAFYGTYYLIKRNLLWLFSWYMIIPIVGTFLLPLYL